MHLHKRHSQLMQVRRVRQLTRLVLLVFIFITILPQNLEPFGQGLCLMKEQTDVITAMEMFKEKYQGSSKSSASFGKGSMKDFIDNKNE